MFTCTCTFWRARVSLCHAPLHVFSNTQNQHVGVWASLKSVLLRSRVLLHDDITTVVVVLNSLC